VVPKIRRRASVMTLRRGTENRDGDHSFAGTVCTGMTIGACAETEFSLLSGGNGIAFVFIHEASSEKWGPRDHY
jgi:hypothetical protein